MKTYIVTEYYGYIVKKDEKGYFISENGKRYKYLKSVQNFIDRLTH